MCVAEGSQVPCGADGPQGVRVRVMRALGFQAPLWPQDRVGRGPQ